MGSCGLALDLLRSSSPIGAQSFTQIEAAAFPGTQGGTNQASAVPQLLTSHCHAIGPRDCEPLS